MIRRTRKTQIRSEGELGNLLYDAMANAVEYTMVKLFEENEDMIEKYVYNAYKPNTYQRTREFLDAWNYKVKKTSSHHMLSYISSRVHATLEYDPSVMDYNPEFAQHGTPLWAANEAWNDAREYLADILYQGNTGPLFGEGDWQKRRDAWTPLLRKLDRGKIYTWFEEGMAKQNLKPYRR